jgi:hypothetical protein
LSLPSMPTSRRGMITPALARLAASIGAAVLTRSLRHIQGR